MPSSALRAVLLATLPCVHPAAAATPAAGANGCGSGLGDGTCITGELQLPAGGPAEKGGNTTDDYTALLQLHLSVGRATAEHPDSSRPHRGASGQRTLARAVAGPTTTSHTKGRPAHVAADLAAAGSVSTSWCGYKGQAGFVTAYTSSSYDTLMLDLTEAMKGGKRLKFVVTAMAVAGTYADGSGYLSEYAYPMEETYSTMFEFSASSDDVSIDVFQPQLERRTSDNQTQEALRRGVGSGWFDKLPTYTCELNEGEHLVVSTEQAATMALDTSTSFTMLQGHHNATAGERNGRIIINGDTLLQQGFYVTPSVSSAVTYRVLSLRSYPRNLDITVEFMMPDGLPQAVGFSLVQLDETPMATRAGDERLLYFTTDYQDLGQHNPQPQELPGESLDRRVTAIWRYDLSRLPGQQIRIYIDPTVPQRWRRWFRQGVELWNEAFALIGRPAAVRAVLPEDAEWPADYDVSDARYNTISWSISDQVVSMGIAKVDPRSGEILKSDILMSDGWVRSWLGDLDLLAPNFTHQLDQLGGYRYEAYSDAGAAVGVPGLLQLQGRGQGRGRSRPKAQGRLGPGEWGKKLGLLSTAKGRPLHAAEREEVLGQGLRHVVAHEMGHILGLRHNFKGSLGVSYACTRDKACSAVHGLSASVMDYVPTNLPSNDGSEVHLFSPVLGAYDKLAIKYGYMEAPDSIPGGHSQAAPELQEVLREAEAFETCYDDDRSLRQDPSCAAYDMSADPLRYMEEQLLRLAQVQASLLNTSVMPGAPYTRYGDAVASVLQLARQVGSDATSWIGGVSNAYVNRRMDGGHSHRVARQAVPGTMQRRAVALLLQTLRPEKAGLLPPSEAFPYLVESSGTAGLVETLDLSEKVRIMTKSLLSHALSASQLQRLHGQERLAQPGAEGDAAFSCGEFLAMLVADVMGDALSSAPHADWDLQALLVEHLGALYAGGLLSEGPASQVLHHLRRIHGEVEAALAKLDDGLGTANVDEGSLLREHVLSLRQTLATAPCGGASAQPCQVLSGRALGQPSPLRASLSAAALAAAALGSLGRAN